MLDVVNSGIEDHLGPFLEADKRMELENQIEQTGYAVMSFRLEIVIFLCVCGDGDDNCDAAFLEILGQYQCEEDWGQVDGHSDDENDTTADQEEPLHKLKTYKKVTICTKEKKKESYTKRCEIPTVFNEL